MEKNTQYEIDKTLITRIKNGDSNAEEELINKYKNLVKLKTRAYFIVGADKEDIVQEGMIGLFKAIRDYNPEKQVTFYSFAEICINRQIITAIKSATRQKHIPLNSYISLNRQVYDDDQDKTYIDLLTTDEISNPEDLFIGQEGKNYIEHHINEALSELECRVLSLYLRGNSYVAIGKIIKKDEKSIDNAIQRIRRKVEKILANKVEKYSKVSAK